MNDELISSNPVNTCRMEFSKYKSPWSGQNIKGTTHSVTLNIIFGTRMGTPSKEVYTLNLGPLYKIEESL